MKIDVTYEEADLKRLIRVDLARQGIPATDADIKLTKCKATVSVEVQGDESAIAVEPQSMPAREYTAPLPPAREAPPAPALPPPVPPTKERSLEVIEGGNNPTDFSDVLRASQRIATTKDGKFPKAERQLMDGESFDYPGDEQ